MLSRKSLNGFRLCYASVCRKIVKVKFCFLWLAKSKNDLRDFVTKPSPPCPPPAPPSSIDIKILHQWLGNISNKDKIHDSLGISFSFKNNYTRNFSNITGSKALACYIIYNDISCIKLTHTCSRLDVNFYIKSLPQNLISLFSRIKQATERWFTVMSHRCMAKYFQQHEWDVLHVSHTYRNFVCGFVR